MQERADRIKAREARRKANLKKREEKIATEREMTRRTGKPIVEDQKAGWRVGASQLSLGNFLGGVRKQHQNYEVFKDRLTGEEERSFEYVSQQEQDGRDESVTLMAPLVQPSAQPIVSDPACQLPKMQSPTCSHIQMPPPPKPQSKQYEVPDEAFDECFPSNTQIQRELSPEPRTNTSNKPTATLRSASIPPARAATAHDLVDANDLLACISTQDLNFSGTFTQGRAPAAKRDEPDLFAEISTQDLDFEDELPNPVTEGDFVDQEMLLAQISTQDLELSQEFIDICTEPKASESEFVDDPTDYDLENLAMVIEKNRSAQILVN